MITPSSILSFLIQECRYDIGEVNFILREIKNDIKKARKELKKARKKSRKIQNTRKLSHRGKMYFEGGVFGCQLRLNALYYEKETFERRLAYYKRKKKFYIGSLSLTHVHT